MDISAIITAHAEGPMAALSFHSLLDAVTEARRLGLTVEVLVVLDNPTSATVSALSAAESRGAIISEVSFADQGAVRNYAVESSSGDYIAFLDGDDLWSENWLTDSYDLCSQDPSAIAHPELNWFFERSGNLFFQADQTDPDFKPEFLRVSNYWDALCLAPVRAYKDHPFSTRAISHGYAYEDWHWNMETIEGGYIHRVVPDTIHFKRRRAFSQNIQAHRNRSLTRPSRFLDYGWSAAATHTF